MHYSGRTAATVCTFHEYSKIDRHHGLRFAFALCWFTLAISQSYTHMAHKVHILGCAADTDTVNYRAMANPIMHTTIYIITRNVVCVVSTHPYNGLSHKDPKLPSTSVCWRWLNGWTQLFPVRIPCAGCAVCRIRPLSSARDKPVENRKTEQKMRANHASRTQNAPNASVWFTGLGAEKPMRSGVVRLHANAGDEGDGLGVCRTGDGWATLWLRSIASV